MVVATGRQHITEATMAVTILNRVTLILITLGLLTLSTFSWGAAQLSAVVDRSIINVQDTLTLDVKFTEQVKSGQPNFAQLKQNFDILSTNRSSQYQNINGRTEASTQWRMTLAPKTSGQLIIPSFEFQDHFSDAITIQVNEAPTGQDAQNQPVYVETEIDNRNVLVQQQSLLTLRLITSVGLTSLEAEELKIDNTIIKKVAEHQFQRTINGKAHAVVEIIYAIYPQQSGTLKIPAVTWTVGLQSQPTDRYDPFGRFSPSKRMRLRTQEDNIQVLVQPSQYTGEHWLPAKNLTMEQQWSQSPDTFKVGEPITRNLTVSVEGLSAAQVPHMNVTAGQDFKIYPDKPRHTEDVSTQGITTTLTESYAIVPNKAGQLTLPAVSITWWDTQQQTMREAQIPAQVVNVAPADAITNPSNTAFTPLDNTMLPSASRAETLHSSASNDSFWPWLAGGLALTTLIFAGLWLRARKTSMPLKAAVHASSSHNGSESQSFKRLQLAAQNNNLQELRDTLIEWAQLRFSHSDINSLQMVLQYTHHEALDEQITALDQALFAQNPEITFDASIFIELVAAIRKRASSKEASASSLEPLYK